MNDETSDEQLRTSDSALVRTVKPKNASTRGRAGHLNTFNSVKRTYDPNGKYSNIYTQK